MKKLACIVLPLLLFGIVAFASDNQSAAWVRTLTREAVTDSVDAAYFNPAGTAFLDKGFHFQAMNLSVFQNYSHKSAVPPDLTVYEAKTPVWFFPTARMAYSAGSWAAFFDFSIPAGGGSLDYKEGTYQFDVLSLMYGPLEGSSTGSSAVFGFSLGGSYRFGDMISIGASGRLLYGNDTAELAVDKGLVTGSAEAKATGIGYGGMFGVDVIPFYGFTFAVTMETGSKLELEYKEVTGSAAIVGLLETELGIAVGNTYDASLPFRLRTGIAYEMPFGLTVSSSFKYDFYKALHKALRDTWSVSGALAYDITDRIEVSVGGSYDIDEVEDVEDYDALNPELSSFTLAGGIGYEVIPGLIVDVGVLNVFYTDESASGAKGFTDMSKKVLLAGIGITYSF